MMVQLYRELATLCHDRNKELWIGLQLGRYTHFSADSHFSANVVARFSNHWKQLVDEGVADAFILGDYEIMTNPDHGYWQAKPDIQRRAGENLFTWAAREYQTYCRAKTRLYLFSEWLPHDPPALAHQLDFWVDVIRTNRFDGIDLHEAWDFECHPDNMAALGRMSERLRSATGSAAEARQTPAP